MRTPGNHNGVILFCKTELRQKAFLFFRRDDAIGLIVLGIPRYDNLIRIGTNIDDILRINPALHTENPD